MATYRPKTRGGHKLNRFIRNAKRAQRTGVKRLQAGFWSSSKYPDGTPVTKVAAIHEFGAPDADIPERPFFRKALQEAPEVLLPILKKNIDPRTMVVDKRTANKLGAALQALIQQHIVSIKDPPNAPSTIAAKGSSNPLVDEGHLKNSVTWSLDL